jgi:hypothetical protein
MVCASLIIIIIIIIINFIIYVPSQQLQGQLQTQHSVDTGNYIKDKHNMKTTATYNNNNKKFWEELIAYFP